MHTKEPWRLGRLHNLQDFEKVRETVGPHQVCVDNEFGPYVLAECNMNFPDDAKANARRIVACVNRLAQFKTEDIENPSFESGMYGVLARITQQRDELLAALEKAEEYLRECANAPILAAGLRATLAKVKL